MCQNDVGNIAGPRTRGNQGPRNEMRQRVEGEEDEENGCHLVEAATPPGDFPWVVTHVAMLDEKREPSTLVRLCTNRQRHPGRVSFQESREV
jgi:hypothetical protein